MRAAAATLTTLVAWLGADAYAADYAPVDQPGPALQVPAAKLRQSMRCTQSVGTTERPAVLFVPPTLVEPDEAFFTYERGLDALGIAYCTVTIPEYTTIDIQVSAEYVVHAIRRLHAATGRPIQLVGWSQGAGPEPRWALRFWPDVRPLVEELVGLEAPNHGAVAARAFRAPALRQQTDDAQFIKALNSRQETFPGIDYTNVYSRTSQFVQPNLDDSGSTSLHGGGGRIENVATQDVCSTNAADHLAYYYDPVGWALTVDALTHDGPAVVERIDAASVCSRMSMPFVSAAEIATYEVHVYNTLFVDRVNTVPQTEAEPPLKCYVTASCATPPRARPALALRVSLPRPRLGVRCTGARATARLGGEDLALVESVRLSAPGGLSREVTRSPFAARLGRVARGLRTFRARVQLTDGRVVDLSRRARACPRPRPRAARS